MINAVAVLMPTPRPTPKPSDVGVLGAGAPAAWVTDDEVCGTHPGLRADLEHRGIGYVLAVGCDRRVHVDDRTPIQGRVAGGRFTLRFSEIPA
ncbi:hypothetical protein [Micromonospora sp. NPDC005299]|uniref:hypothetical protein n=1 Tax=Micromonospora sp. NPDC005299 TaxID=3364231 RepID=UPI0036B54815